MEKKITHLIFPKFVINKNNMSNEKAATSLKNTLFKFIDVLVLVLVFSENLDHKAFTRIIV